MYSGWEAQEVKHNHNSQEFDYNSEVKTGAYEAKKSTTVFLRHKFI